MPVSNTSLQQYYSIFLCKDILFIFYQKVSLMNMPKYKIPCTDVLHLFSLIFQACVNWFSDNFQKHEGRSETSRGFLLTCLASVTALLISFLQIIICPERVASSPSLLLDRPADTALKCCCAAAKACASFSLASTKTSSSFSRFFTSFSFDSNALESFSKRKNNNKKNQQPINKQKTTKKQTNKHTHKKTQN